jgi:uncharacterized protein YukE
MNLTAEVLAVNVPARQEMSLICRWELWWRGGGLNGNTILHQLTRGNTMAQAIMDPEKVRRFAEELQRFNSDLENRLGLLHARFNALGDTWQDQEHEKFSEEFQQAMKALKRFVELSKQHTPYLLRKAQRIEEYLNQR